MNDGLFYAVIASICAALLTGVVTSAAIYGTLTADCAAFGKFRYNNEVYECKKVPR
jgi:hypothetical protein